MDLSRKTLQSVPLFRHCSAAEIRDLMQIARHSRVKRGMMLDLRKNTTLNIVLKGVFEIEALGSTDIVYLSPGSWFGSVPFSTNRLRGRIRALADSELLMIDIGDLSRFLLLSYRSLRGFLTVAGRLGLELSETGQRYHNTRTRVTTVTGPADKSGRTLMAGLLARRLSLDSKTVVIDLSYGGRSVFSVLGEMLPAPLAHREHSADEADDLIEERLVYREDGVSLLNVAQGARVKVDPGILAPVLFVLSARFHHIVIDCSGDDTGLLERSIALSDFVLSLVNDRKRMEKEQVRYEKLLRDGQRLLFVQNRQAVKGQEPLEGALALDRLSYREGKTGQEEFEKLCREESVENIAGEISRLRRGVVVESRLLDSLFFSDLFYSLFHEETSVDRVYTSAWSFILAGLALSSPDKEAFRRSIDRVFEESQVNRYLNITFPEDHIFESKALLKLFSHGESGIRIEGFRTLLSLKLYDEEQKESRQVTSGNLASLMASSLSVSPFFNPVSTAGSLHSSGYPSVKVQPEDLLRGAVDQISFVAVHNSEYLQYHRGDILPFYEKLLEYIRRDDRPGELSEVMDDYFLLEVHENDMKIDRIIEQGKERTGNIMTRIIKNEERKG